MSVKIKRQKMEIVTILFGINYLIFIEFFLVIEKAAQFSYKHGILIHNYNNKQ